ncbi:STAS domain-containing protein [Actinoplanes sp. NPDC020271]|uniref:STAS domain-containing protein n=1 Tax=Actinoplanes sp. NPDC020271 TaxID=3363896 RepID=UPI0037950E61
MEQDHALRIGAPMTVDDRTVRVDLAGELDGPNTAALVAAFDQVMTASGAALITLGLSRLTFVDSAGLQALVECRQAAAAAGRRLELRDPLPIVRQVLTITELLDDFGLE